MRDDATAPVNSAWRRPIFRNSTGLPDRRSKTTMRDMATARRRISSSNYPDLYQYFAQPDFEWNKIFQRNRNPLISADLGVDGFATGFAEGFGYWRSSPPCRTDGKAAFFWRSAALPPTRSGRGNAQVLEWATDGLREPTDLFDEQAIVIGEASVYGGTVSHVDLVAKRRSSVYMPVNNPDRLSAKDHLSLAADRRRSRPA